MRAKEGRCEGAKPYGSLAGEAAVLQRIRSMRMAGNSYQTIATALNTDGIPRGAVFGGIPLP
jgi:hypothetical protein